MLNKYVTKDNTRFVSNSSILIFWHLQIVNGLLQRKNCKKAYMTRIIAR